MDGEKDRVAATVAFLDAVEASEREDNSAEPTAVGERPPTPPVEGQPTDKDTPAPAPTDAPAAEGKPGEAPTSEKPSEPAPAAKPGEPAPVPAEFVFKVRGAERKFDLTKPEEQEELRRLASMGSNYDAHMREFDQKVGQRVNESLARWAYEQGWLVPNPQDPNQPFGDPDKGLQMLVRYLGADAVREAASKFVGATPAPTGSGPLAEMLQRQADIEKHLNPDDDPKDAILKEAFGATKMLAQQVIDLQKKFDSTVQPLNDWRAKTEQDGQQRQTIETANRFKTFADSEILKYDILKGNDKIPAIDEDERTLIANKSRALFAEARQRGENITPEVAIQRGVKWAADRRSRLLGASATAVRQTQEELRPKPTTAPPATPGRGIPANPAGKPKGPVMSGSPEAVRRNVEFLDRWEREHSG